MEFSPLIQSPGSGAGSGSTISGFGSRSKWNGSTSRVIFIIFLGSKPTVLEIRRLWTGKWPILTTSFHNSMLYLWYDLLIHTYVSYSVSLMHRQFANCPLQFTNFIRAGEPEPGVFGFLEPEPLEKKKQGAGAAWKKSQEPGVFGSLEPEPLGKKIRSRSRLKKSQEPEPEPEPLKNLPAPQPWILSILLFKRVTFFYTDNNCLVWRMNNAAQWWNPNVWNILYL